MTTFYFDINKILDKVETAALYRARNIKDRTPDFAELSIVDAKDFLKDQLRYIAAKIFDTEFSQYPPVADPAVEPFEFDVTYDGNPDHIVYRCTFPAGYNSSLHTATVHAIESALVKYVVMEWIKAANYDYRQNEADYEKAMDDIRSLVARRKNLKRTYHLF